MKWNSIRDKIVESRCDIACLQETKKEHFGQLFVRNICLPFYHFKFLPHGCFGWHNYCLGRCFFSAVLVVQNEFPLSIEFTSMNNDKSCILTNVCMDRVLQIGKRIILSWFKIIYQLFCLSPNKMDLPSLKSARYFRRHEYFVLPLQIKSCLLISTLCQCTHIYDTNGQRL